MGLSSTEMRMTGPKTHWSVYASKISYFIYIASCVSIIFLIIIALVSKEKALLMLTVPTGLISMIAYAVYFLTFPIDVTDEDVADQEMLIFEERKRKINGAKTEILLLFFFCALMLGYLLF